MGGRRFAPLIAVVLLGAAVLIARLYTLQVLETGIWSAQAASLVRDGTVEPYTRGELLDARGKVLAKDVESYRIDADYRDFRRGNALGVVAHARSTLEMRPVPLSEARAALEPWALALGRLSAADLESFARGGALACAGLQLAETGSPQLDSRSGRAVDLGFYCVALFDLKPRERSRLKARDEADRSLAFVDRIARERGVRREDVERTLVERCRNDAQFLDDFAVLRAEDSGRTAAPPLALVLAELERWRAEVEDGAASDLFEAALGFPAGRLESRCLEEFFDLDWIRRALRWDAPRLAAWTGSARAQWLEARDGPVLDFAVERARRDAGRATPAELVLRELPPLFAAPPRGRRSALAAESAWPCDRPALLFSELDSLFAVDVPRRLAAEPSLPTCDPDFAQLVAQAGSDAGVLARVEFWAADGGSADAGLLEASAAAWRARFAKTPDRAQLRQGFEALLSRLEDAFQAQARERLAEVHAAAREAGELDPLGKLPIAAGRLDRAEERARYILKDRGSRHFVAVARPSYPLVNLLTRYPHYLRGFQVARVHLRVNPTRDAQDRAVARLLVGRLAPPSVARRLSQAEIARQIRELEGLAGRDEEAEDRLAELRASLDLPDEQVGAFGLERWFEPELAGRNGFHEETGLAEREAGARARRGIDKIDGLSVTTTLDAVLQEEAEYCLEHPDGDRDSPEKSDANFLRYPTGAIVLLTPAGDIVAAASVPLAARAPTRGPSAISDDVRERTLTKPDFQPPGSVFKIFVAPYALALLGLDPRTVRECSPAMNPGGRGAGYGGVHCHELSTGHGAVDLRRALRVSCNSYFAWLGEQYDAASLYEMAHEFGFGEPTGVRSLGGERRGIYEDCVPNLFQRGPLTGRSLCEAGNGLSVVEATPMQVARATAALATGRLPTLRFASRIGGEELPHEGRPLALSKEALDFVRAAMLEVTAHPEGSAHAALSESELGFRMAAKTGSADLTSEAVEDQRVMKHTWLAGWFPAEDPVGVLVVFQHRTTRTSSHGAIWLARQFLTRPAVSEWIAERVSSR